MTLDRAEIARRIPHHGDMCLLDTVETWDETHIRCRASSNRQAVTPLRAAGRLGIANGVEYAAQAMAVHGSLLAAADEAPRVGYLTSIRDVHWHTDRLDNQELDLQIEAERLSGDARAIIYQFSVRTGDQLLISGRASVMLDAQRG